MLAFFPASILAVNTVSLHPQSLSQELLSPAPLTQVLPADTPFVGLINTKTEKWQTLTRFELFKQVFAVGENRLPIQMGLNYETDIKPWLGEQVALAFMPQKAAKSVKLDDSFLVVAAVKDKEQLHVSIDKLKAHKPQEIVERQYKGVKILEWKPSQPTTPNSPKIAPPVSKSLFSPLKSSKLPTSFVAAIPGFPTLPISKPDSIKRKGLAIAIFSGYVVTASNAIPIEQLIDTPLGSASLAQNPNFKQITQHPQYSKALFTLYEDPNKFLALLTSLAQDPNLPSPIPLGAINFAQVEQYSFLNGLIWEQKEGLRLQLNTHRKQPSLANAFTPNTAQLLPRIPAPAYSTTTGRNIYGQWQMLVTVLSSNPQFKDGLAKFRKAITSITGLDIRPLA